MLKQVAVNEILVKNNVKVFGTGQPMLFAHGFGCDQNMWRFIIPAFEKQYKIVLFDYVGSGKSDITAYNAEKYSDLNGYANDILDIVTALDLNDIVFVGHSVSCMIGLLASLKQPNRFNKMIFIGPSARYINDQPSYIGGFERKDIKELLETMDKNYIGWANFLAPAIMKNPDKPELGEELAASFCSTDPVIARQFAEVTFLSDNREDLSKLKIPALILQCSDDLIAPLEVGTYLEQQISGSTLKIMKATGHCPHMSAPAETIELMSNYLATAS
ncbi:alpha/beta hydrolase [Segetibacter sp.]|jgi:sigma-B regulation protein RsbQ|uniref:alpha/beta fold hydrolase n=1 Tax=Segetibacter sp. TaxID=2231182 RepID=UPI00261E28DF|nr:alpha/beta hydrolase [Segetibacter sp.]MCW3079904.1 alpha/beta hydrolase fold protein [Segetibacter sp.]